MEELSTKRSNIAPSAIYTIAKLAETAIKRDVENLKSIGGEHPEVKVLKEKCKDADPIVSISAGHALVTLVEAGVLSIPYTLSTFIAILPYCLSPIGVTSALAKLLILDLKMRVDGERKYKSPFNLQSPQHPLLTVVKQNKDSWHHVINQIASLCNHPDSVVQRNSGELVRPVVLYMMCDPGNQNAVYHQELWAILLSLPDTTLLEVCIPWLQATDPKCIQPLYVLLASSLKLKKILENSIVSTPNVVIQMAGLVYALVSTGADPCRILRCINDFLPECCAFVGSCLIVTLAQAILKSPSTYLSPIICLCSNIAKQQLCIGLAGKMLAASLLPWLAQPSIITTEALQEMQNLMIDLDALSNVTMSNSPVLFHPLSITHISAQTCILLKSWSRDSDILLQWMNCVETAPTAFRRDLFLMVGGLIIEETTSSVLLNKCLSFMLKLTADLPELGTTVLTWFLYRLAREKEPEDQLQLLRALPSLGSQKENVALVIHTLESLKESQQIKCLVLNLYLRLWHQEPRCFPYLHKMLSESMPEKSVLQREWTIACAATMKEICDTRPSLHGTDLVPLLSNVLNNSMSSEGAVASSLAIQAIVLLCEARIVDVATTWRALAPRLSRDTRVAVIRSLCDLLGLMSNIKSTNTDQSKLFAESQAKLWSYVVNNDDHDVKTAALRGLSQFPLEQLSLKIMPPCFRQNLKLPPEYAKTPIDAARKPEDVLPYIPGECWPQLLAAVPCATVLLKTLLSTEVSAMRGALHRHPGKAEPPLPSLARNSVCLGLISHLRRCTDEPDAAVVPCLEVLSSLSKALPPCDWSFLQDLAKHEQCYFLCLTLATRQAHCSPSARIVAENLVEKLGTRTSTKDDVLAGFTILEDMCKGVPPKTLRPLIETALQSSLKAAQNKDTKDVSLFRELMRHMKRALQKEDIHDANRTLLSMILEGILEQLGLDDEEVFSCYVETVGELSSKFLDRMSSPSVWWEVTPVKLQKAIAIRGHIAVQADSEAPLIWLNECVDAAAATNPREQDLLLCKLYEVLVFSHGKSTNKDWVLELMGHIQAALTSTDKLEEASFLCDVFALAVVVLSGHHCLCPKPTAAAESKETRLLLLPQALLSLLEYPEWETVTGQIIEWLHHLIKSTVICPDLKPVLYKCLQALRHTGPMQQPSLWQRVVSV